MSWDVAAVGVLGTRASLAVRAGEGVAVLARSRALGERRDWLQKEERL